MEVEEEEEEGLLGEGWRLREEGRVFSSAAHRAHTAQSGRASSTPTTRERERERERAREREPVTAIHRQREREREREITGRERTETLWARRFLCQSQSLRKSDRDQEIEREIKRE